jgi:hypothetical protein
LFGVRHSPSQTGVNALAAHPTKNLSFSFLLSLSSFLSSFLFAFRFFCLPPR